MAIDPMKLKVGDRCWWVESYRMGNTTQKSLAVYDVVVMKIDETSRYGDRKITVRWNSAMNEEIWSSSHKNWRKCQKTITTVLGEYGFKRRLRRGEALRPGTRTRLYDADGEYFDTTH